MGKGRIINQTIIKQQMEQFPVNMCRGQHTLLLCDNSVTNIVIYLFCIKQRIPLIMLDCKLKEEMIRDYLDSMQPYWVFRPVKGKRENDGYRRICEWNGYRIECCIAPKACFDSWMEDLALLIPTSGSTGEQKFVMLTYDNLHSNAENIVRSLQIKKTDRAAVLLPIAYSYGLSVINSYLLAGATLLVPEAEIFRSECWDFLEKECVNAICGVPYSYEVYRKLHVFDREFRHLTLITQAGGALSRDMKLYLLKEAERRKAHFAVMYGQTEATARISCFFLDEHPDKIDSVGCVLPNGRLQIYQPDQDGQGEVVYEGRNVFLGYATSIDDMRQSSQKGNQCDRQLFTGDIGWLDKDGYLYITGRRKRFVKLCGYRINLDSLQQSISRKMQQKVICVNAVIRGEEKVFLFGEQPYRQMDTKWLLQQYPILYNHWQYIQLEKIPVNLNGKIDYSVLLQYIEMTSSA